MDKTSLDFSRNMQISGQVYKGLVTSNKGEISSEALENLCHHQTLLCSSCFGLLCWILERIFIEIIFVESRTIAGLSQDYRRTITGLLQDYHRTIAGSLPCHPESSGLLVLRISYTSLRLSQPWTVKVKATGYIDCEC